MGTIASRRPLLLALVTVLLLPPASACSSRCGNISIAYPFGIEPGCYKDGFNLTCNHSYHPPKLFLGYGTVQVLEISIPNGTVRINSSELVALRNGRTWGGLREGGPFFLAPYRNKLFVMSCNITQFILMGDDNSTVNACSTFCPQEGTRKQPDLQVELLLDDCAGIGCCDAVIPRGYTSYNIKLQAPTSSDLLAAIFLAEVGSISIRSILYGSPTGQEVFPALLDWVISNSTCHEELLASECLSSNSFCRNYTSYAYDGHQCSCSAGYEGNPYIPNGCQDINECANPQVHSCHGICINTPGTFYCRCPDGTGGNSSVPGGCIKIKNYSAEEPR
ncbi:hypothetical protein ACP4OV_018023 [Aristida adscensionis]